MNRNDFQTVLILNRFLPNDISRLIIKFKRDGEHNDAIIERTEVDFHNWLEYDIEVRSYLGGIMMNYQKMDSVMKNYATIFHESSLIEKAEAEKNNSCDRAIFEGINEERVNLNGSEINYLYASTK